MIYVYIYVHIYIYSIVQKKRHCAAECIITCRRVSGLLIGDSTAISSPLLSCDLFGGVALLVFAMYVLPFILGIEFCLEVSCPIPEGSLGLEAKAPQ